MAVATERSERELSIAGAAEISGLSAHTLRCCELRASSNPSVAAEWSSSLPGGGPRAHEVSHASSRHRDADATNAERRRLLERHRDAVLAGLETTIKSLELIEWKITFDKERLG